MNCALALRMLDAYIDDEVDAATAAEMTGHLASCPACAGLHGQRVAMRTALRAAPLRHVAPPGLRKSILREIERSAVVGRTRGGRCAGGRRWRSASRPPSWARLEGGGSRSRACWRRSPNSRWRGTSRRSRPRVRASTSRRPIATKCAPGSRVGSNSRRWCGTCPRRDSTSSARRVDRLGDRQAVAVVYRLHNHIINVFSWRGSGDVAATAREATIRGFHVVTWNDRDMDFAAVSDTDSAELKRFTTAYRAP